MAPGANVLALDDAEFLKTNGKLRVLFSCTGVGIFNRGIESFFREAFDGLKETPGLDAWLIKGAGARLANEIPVWCLPRTGWSARWFGALIRRSSYVAEQLSSVPFVARQIRLLRPQVIFYSDANLGFQLYFRRKWIGVPYRLLFSNGGPVSAPFVRMDFVHQVAPPYYSAALAAGEPAKKHFMVPYGIHVPPPPDFDRSKRQALRSRLNLLLDRPIILSVGWIAREHKRMHYVIEELAQLPQPRPFLQLLGAIDESSREIIDLGNHLLGPENFSAKSVPYEQVADYYRAADCFVLASLKEGFGRVYIEALMNGLPVVAHRHPVMEFVLDGEGVFGNLEKRGELSGLIRNQLQVPADGKVMRRRWENVKNRFSWPVLASQYLEMFQETIVRG
jgi:glycosyltransferase involved in cell wall biosynthesis